MKSILIFSGILIRANFQITSLNLLFISSIQFQIRHSYLILKTFKSALSVMMIEDTQDRRDRPATDDESEVVL